MVAFSKKMQAKAAVAIAAEDPVAAKNLKDGQEFLAKNKLKKGVVTTESGLQYEVLASGKGPSPKKTDKVRVHYHGTVLSGKVFDSSVQRKEPAEFGVNEVIPGWTEAPAENESRRQVAGVPPGRSGLRLRVARRSDHAIFGADL